MVRQTAPHLTAGARAQQREREGGRADPAVPDGCGQGTCPVLSPEGARGRGGQGAGSAQRGGGTAPKSVAGQVRM